MQFTKNTLDVAVNSLNYAKKMLEVMTSMSLGGNLHTDPVIKQLTILKSKSQAAERRKCDAPAAVC